MSNFLSYFVLFPEGIEHYRGQKAVLAVMAFDRNLEQFKTAERVFAELEKDEDIILMMEDHPGGRLHEQFECRVREFCCALVDRRGNVLMRCDQVPSLRSVRAHLEAAAHD